MASRVVCVAPEWLLALGPDGTLERTLRLWAGTSSGWIHRCGSDDEPAPLLSLHIDHVPRSIEVLQLQVSRAPHAALSAQAGPG